MKFFSIHKFLAIMLTVSFVGTSILAPLAAEAVAQQPMGGEFKQTDQKHDITDIFSDPQMQKDVALIGASCIAAAYLPSTLEVISGGISTALEGLKGLGAKEAVMAKAETIVGPKGIAQQEIADTSSAGAFVAAGASQVVSVPIASIPISTGLAAIDTAISGLHDTINSSSIATEMNNVSRQGKTTVADCLIYGAGQMLLKQLTDNTVKWIQGGFHGSPSFAVNTHEIFLDLADMVAGDLAREIRGLSMCKFRANFQNDLANNIELSAKHVYKFNDATKCPFPETINLSSSDFYKGVNQFTWEGMEYALQDNGNPFGVALLSGQELSLRSSEQADVRKQELSWSNGFTNMVDTTNCNYPEGVSIDGSGKGTYDATAGKDNTMMIEAGMYEPGVTGVTELSSAETRELQKTYCPTTTPGKMIGDSLSKATGVDMDRLGAVKDLNQIFAALIERFTTDASMGIFKALSGQDNAKVQQNYITTQDTTAETIFMENYAIKSAKDALAAAQQELATAQASPDTEVKATIPGLQQKVAELQKNADAVASPERSIARQTELTAAHQELASALSVEKTAQTQNDAAQKAYYTALQGTLEGGVYIQPEPATLANLKANWSNANDALVRAQGVTANARQRLYDAQHPAS